MSFTDERHKMVANQLVARGVRDPRVLEAMNRVQRHRFVPSDRAKEAYEDHPVALTRGQTMSQPYIVARMLELCELKGDERVLEIGSGSGYQTALLAELAKEVYAVEILPELCEWAKRILGEMGYRNARLECFDGTYGFSEAAPFDVILAGAGAPRVPPLWLAQLAPAGRLVLPVGPRDDQNLTRILRVGPDDYKTTIDTSCRFVDLVGRYGWGGAGPPQA